MKDNKHYKSVSLFKRKWFSLICIFLLSQLIFITFEAIGWLPNLKDIDGTLFGTIAESSTFNEWFSFYETPHFNIFTAFFGITLLVPGIIGGIKDVFKMVTKSRVL